MTHAPHAAQTALAAETPASYKPAAAARLAKVRKALSEQDLPAVLVTKMDNVGWLSGFTGSNAFVIVTQETALFATDSRYVTQAAEECPGFAREQLKTSAPDEITGLLGALRMQRVGFEAGHLTYKAVETYREKLPAGVELVPTNGIVEKLRLVKDEVEIAAIERACALADRTFDHIVPFLKPGAVERDVMLELEWFMRKEGRAEVAFDTIVASGPRSALPHGRAAERAMQPGDFVTLDFGAKLDSYCSDITRTVVLGRPTDEQRKVYGTVLEAMERAIAAMRPGANGKAVDAIGRDFIGAAGYGEYFGHGLGHSLGRAVHDGEGLSIRSELTLGPGMVITVEPGIYIPEWGGCRIEQDVLVTDAEPRVLTHSTTEMLALE